MDTLPLTALERLCSAATSVAYEELRARLRGAHHPAALEERLRAGLKLLHGLLTTHKQDRRSDYLSDPRLHLAYLVHHFPMHAAKVAHLCRSVLPARPAAWGEELRIMDLGAGPLSAAAGTLLAWPGPARILAVDRVGAMMQLGVRSVAALEGTARVTLHTGLMQDAITHARTFAPHVTVMANALSEMGPSHAAVKARAHFVWKLLAALPPQGHLLIVEPGTRVHAQELVELRDLLLGGGGASQVHVWAPCMGSPRCPLLGSQDWCHAELPLSWPSAYAQRAARAGIVAQALKWSHLWISASPAPAVPKGLVRLIGGPMSPQPTRLLRYACGPHGRVTLAQSGSALASQPLHTAPRGAAYTPGTGVETLPPEAIKGSPHPPHARRRPHRQEQCHPPRRRGS